MQPHEHLLFAKFDYECRVNGASNLAYLPVVAGKKPSKVGWFFYLLLAHAYTCTVKLQKVAK